MADTYTTTILFWKPTNLLSDQRGAYLRAVADEDEANRIIGDTTNAVYAAAEEQYGGGIMAQAADVTIPLWADPGNSYYWESDKAMHMSGEQNPVLLLRGGLQLWHQALEDIGTLLTSVSHRYPNSDVMLASDVLFELHRGAYMVCTDTSINIALRLSWLQNSALGPTDYDRDDPETFFERVDTLTTRTATAPLSVVAPSGRYNSRRTFATMLNNPLTGTAPTLAQLDRGRWIGGITS